MFSKKKTLTARAIVALVGFIMAFMGLVPSVAFADDPAVTSAPGIPADSAPSKPNCTEKEQNDWKQKAQKCDEDSKTCRDAKAASDAALLACLADKAPATPKSTPTTKPYKLHCGFGTTGQGGIAIHNDVEATATTGVKHCTCSNPTEDKRITSVVGAIGKVEICMPVGLAANKAATKMDIAELRAMIDLIKRDKPLSQQQIEVLDPSLRRDIDELKRRADENDIDVAEIKSHIRLPDMEVLVGAGIGFGGRNGFIFDVILHTGVYGWINDDIGLRALGGLGFAIEPADSDQVSPWMTFNGTVGPAFALDDDRQFVLGVGPSFRQTVRTTSTGDGAKGHFFGGSYGGQVDLRIQLGEAPVAITPYGQLGYGPVAGWSEGRPFEMNAPQFNLGLTIDILAGKHFDDE
jgi:hypothetical protein